LEKTQLSNKTKDQISAFLILNKASRLFYENTQETVDKARDQKRAYFFRVHVLRGRCLTRWQTTAGDVIRIRLAAKPA
jgi:hypothetical protein